MILLISPSICFHNIYIIKFDVLIEEHLLQIVTTKRVLDYETFHSKGRFLGKGKENWGAGRNPLKTNLLVL